MAPSIECIEFYIFDVDDPLHFVMTDEERRPRPIDCSHEKVIDISGGAKTTLASLILSKFVIFRYSLNLFLHR